MKRAINKDRLEVVECTHPLYIEKLDGATLKGADKMFSMLSYDYEEYTDRGWTARIRDATERDAPYNWVIDIIRPETDQEYHNRLAKEERLAVELEYLAKKAKQSASTAARVQAELAEYNRLRKIYGDFPWQD